ncbi:unnamed protein product [Ambrosiozyma monospora]|uniref:Protein transport protein SFT2 n=1 Tax=Ambrosiozyma monospora TaxID=43982 RepID=A0A9W6Z0M0_AMBMO|nr:unnamed protein product [Ambrosiozyma monospora]
MAALRSMLNRVPGVSLPEDDPILPTTAPSVSASAPAPAPAPPSTAGSGSTFFSVFKNPFGTSQNSVSLGQEDTTIASGSTTTSTNAIAREQAQEPSDNIFNLSYFERVSLFIVTLLGSGACFIICITLFPFLSLKPKKFAIIWSLGSILFLISFCFLNGFIKFYHHLVSKERLWFSVGFILSIFVTLLFSVVYHSTLLVIPACVVQLICTVWYTVSYFPYGRQGLQMTSNVARSQVENWINS